MRQQQWLAAAFLFGIDVIVDLIGSKGRFPGARGDRITRWLRVLRGVGHRRGAWQTNKAWQLTRGEGTPRSRLKF